MPTPNASFQSTEQSQKWANARDRVQNHVGSTGMAPDPYSSRHKVEYWVGVFNVSKRTLVVPRSWTFNGRVVIPGRGEEDMYGAPFIIPDIVNLKRRLPAQDDMIPAPENGTWLAQDICNSNDPYGDWRTYKPLNPDTSGSDGNAYYERGIFWCKLETPESEPDVEALSAAIDRLEVYYNRLMKEGNTFYQQGPKGQAMIGEPHHEAAEYFQAANPELEIPWHLTLGGGMKAKLKAKIAKDAKEKKATS